MLPILTRLRVPAGFLLAGLYIWLAHPTGPLWPAGIALAFLGMLFRGWAAGHVPQERPTGRLRPLLLHPSSSLPGQLRDRPGIQPGGEQSDHPGPVSGLLLPDVRTGHAGRGGAAETPVPRPLSRLPEDRPLLYPHPLGRPAAARPRSACNTTAATASTRCFWGSPAPWPCSSGRPGGFERWRPKRHGTVFPQAASRSRISFPQPRALV